MSLAELIAPRSSAQELFTNLASTLHPATLQADTDRAVQAERRVRVLEDALEKERVYSSAVLTSVEQQSLTDVSPSPSAPESLPTKIDPTSDQLYPVLLSFVEKQEPTSNMQNFCAAVLSKCADPTSGRGDLFRKDRQRRLRFSILRGHKEQSLSSAPCADLSPRTAAKRVYRCALVLDRQLNSISNSPEHKDAVLRGLVKRCGYDLFKPDDIELSPHQLLALRDHMKNSTNSMCRLQQALQAFLPNFRILPKNVKKIISNLENLGVVPSKLVVITDCVLTKKGNKRGNRNFYFSSSPTTLLGLMLRRLVLDGTMEESFLFSSLENKIVVAIGFDKSDSDFVGTWRICNRARGNSSVFVQSFACMEGPIAECYENEAKTIGNDIYPIRDTVQSALRDELFAITLALPDERDCTCFVFKPTDPLPPSTPRDIVASLKGPTVIDDDVTWSPIDPVGRSPAVPMPGSTDNIEVNLICSSDDKSKLVGLRFVVNGEVAATHRLHRSMDMGRDRVPDMLIHCQQISGHVSNDGKQINILTGQASCSVTYPMPCCMVSKHDLGRRPFWMQKLFWRHAIYATADARSRERGEIPMALADLPVPLVDLIIKFSGVELQEDAQLREGKFTFELTHRKWVSLTRGGRHYQTQADRKRDNKTVGSSFHRPLILTPCVKENGGIMHTPCGHQNHFWISINNAIVERMRDCDWQLKLSTIDDEIEEKIKDNARKKKDFVEAGEMKVSVI